MRTVFIVIIIIQLCLLALGVYLLTIGSVFFGLYTIIVNALFFPINIDNLQNRN